MFDEIYQNAASSEYESLLEKGRAMINERHHQKAILLFDKAGVIESRRPEWLYEKARALFYMGQFSESITTCEQVLDRDPFFYDALSFGWAMRLEEEKSSEHIKKIVRNEIEDLLNSGKDKISVLMAAFEGYQWLKDRDQEQKLIISLAQKAGSESRETIEFIATRLFEQIVQEKEDKILRIALLEAYVKNFPRERYAAYAAFQLLKTKKEQTGDDFDAEKFAKILLNNVPNSHQLKTGVALWLVENNQNPEFAVHLLSETLVLTEQKPQGKPQFFKPDLWEKELEKQKDKIHLLLGRAWFNAGNFDEASKAFYRVAEKKYPWGDVYYYLAKIALAEGQKDEAIENFCRSLEFGKREDDEKEILTCLLSEEYGFEGNPAIYFSDIKNNIYFSDVTEAAGLGNVKAKRLAWGDYDQDGFDDLLLDGNLVFKNAGDGRFINTTNTSGLDRLKKTNGGIWGDYNNDGLPDIFITGRSKNHLFENMGKGLFSDQTAILPDIAAPMQTEAAAWGDLDNDGFLDLYVANYETWGVMRAIGNHDRLYKNISGSRFKDITDVAGIKTDEAMCGRGVTWTDINMDGFCDIVVANYRLDPNFLWLNNQSVLTESADVFGMRGYETEGAFGHSVGPVSGDLDNDGNLDVFITNLAHPRYIEFSDVNMMLMSQGLPDYQFADQYKESGILFEETNSDPALRDIDNDGDLDLYMSSIYPGRYSHLYQNDGKGFFTDISWMSGTRVGNSWGSAFADFDNDGFADLLVASADGVHLFKNNGNSNHWVKVKIYDTQCNRFGIGCRVTVKYGSKQQVREVTAGRGSGSQDALAPIFGLGDYEGSVEIVAKTLCGDILKEVIDHPDQAVVLTQ
ncbi:MAG: FG-GAP-like repeat-containing protein [Desulfobacteraceae bacterium]|nr:FG-GAP-like repeat-containing protein [Desulfobacteraceae bacterium]